MANEEKPEWMELVRERLARLNLPPRAKEAVVAELAAHLEDSALTDQTTKEPENRALPDIQWHRLAQAIESTKSEEGAMNHRTKTLWLLAIALLFALGLVLVLLDRAALVQRVIFLACMAMFLYTAASESDRLSPQARRFWLPALITLTGASVSLMLTQFLGMQPHIVWINRLAIAFYWPWLATLPIFGALGARLSQRADGPVPARLTAGLSPALAMLIVMCLILPWGLVIDGMDFIRCVSFGIGLVNWVAIPGFALFLGAAPFLRSRSDQSARALA